IGHLPNVDYLVIAGCEETPAVGIECEHVASAHPPIGLHDQLGGITLTAVELAQCRARRQEAKSKRTKHRYQSHRPWHGGLRTVLLFWRALNPIWHRQFNYAVSATP